MINHKVHGGFHKGHGEFFKGRALSTLWFFSLCTLMLIFFATSLKAIPPRDTTKQQYALNNPRNPNCPCHKYQKLAEEEYRDLLNEKHTIYKSKNKHHYKSLIELFFIRKKGIMNNHVKTKKHKSRNNRCYKF